MDGIEEDGGYSDDDLDALPIDDFEELQEDAIRSTQQPRVFTQNRLPIGHGHIDSVGRSEAFEKRNVHRHGSNHPHQPSSDYGDFDDEMLDGEIFDAAEEPSILPAETQTLRFSGQGVQKDQWIQQGARGPSMGVGLQNLQINAFQRPGQSLGQHESQATKNLVAIHGQQSQKPTQPVAPPTDVEDLQAKISELLRANEQLKKESDAAKREALAKTGEISIVRTNRAKEKQEEERRLAGERKLRADEQAKYNAEVLNYKAELQKVATDKAFVENDLFREAEQRKGAQKALKGALKSKTLGKENEAITPKKNRDLPFGDGFNEDEIQAPSPSKLTLRSKPATPKAGSKRKRKPTENSPVKPLQLSQTNKTEAAAQQDSRVEDQSFSEPAQVQEEGSLKSIHQPFATQDERFEVTQKILDHRLDPDGKRSLELLTDYLLPSKPDRTLSSALLDGLSPSSRTARIDSVEVTIGLTAISLWSQCLDAAMYHPVVLLMDLVRFILVTSPPGTAHHFTDELSVLAQRTADLNLIPRIRRKPPSKVTVEMKTKHCLEILHLMAYNCMWQKDDLERFWRCMRVDFIAMALKVDQPVGEIHIALDLLRAGVLENTFAMVRSAADGDQENSEQGLIQIMSSLLIESPRVREGQEPYDATEIAQLRLEVLSLMEKMCETDHGGEALAKCVNVFVRLIRFMNDEINALYDYQPGHELRIELINESMRLLYHITTTYSHLINIQERLATIPGGAHKYLIVLTRLNFSDGIFYEQGIEDDVVECAQHLLENWVTPEEGEALVEAFSSARK